MKSIKALLCLMLISTLYVPLCQGSDLPDPPAGYTWVTNKETKTNFLKPDGWFFKKEKVNETWGYFITKENIDNIGWFATGLTVNIIPRIPQKQNVAPSVYATAFRQVAIENKNVEKTWDHTMGPFQAFGYRLINNEPPKGSYVTHNLLIANDSTGTLYLIIFESPQQSWESAWVTGEPMLNYLGIDTDI